ncbi:MAG TPA: 2-C-methyl-D-erythritol 4-phosphate cytidylyltransferase, partial [Solirubrobacterales bacterium]|nr:2-C-methyl-D-erythritol 4-phosphate cytidylyltransferase [Solirubrobacterales bacterium]
MRPRSGSSAVTAVIAAAGSGERLGAGGPKALVGCGGRPLIEWSLEAFAAAASIDAVVIAAPPGHEGEFGDAAAVVCGG